MISLGSGEDPSFAATDVDEGWEAHGEWTPIQSMGGVQSGRALIINVMLGARLGDQEVNLEIYQKHLVVPILSFSKKMWDWPMRVEGVGNTHIEKANSFQHLKNLCSIQEDSAIVR